MRRALVRALAVCALSACDEQRKTPAAPRPTSEASTKLGAKESSARSRLAVVRDGYLADWLRSEPGAGRTLGLHEYDGKLADYSRSSIEAYVQVLQRTLQALASIDQRSLSADDALDCALLQNHVKLALFRRVDAPEWQTKPQYYEELFAVNAYLDRDYAPLAERAKALLIHETAALRQVSNIRKNLRPPLSKPIVETAIKIYRGYAEYLRGDVKKQLSALKDAKFQAEFARTNEPLAREAQGLADYLQAVELPRADASHALGVERYRKLLQIQEGLSLPLSEFKAKAEENLAQNKSRYEELSRTTKETRPTAATLLGEASSWMERARQFVVDKQLITMPGAGTDRARVLETPPYMRYNAAFLNGPGPFDPAKEAFYYVTLPNPAWPKREQEEYVMTYGNLLTTTVHEVYPGHFVQGQWMRRAATRVQKMIDSYSFIEGWAHYVEQMMVDEGFGGTDPQYRLGQLNDALLRNCRVVASIGIHAEGMSVEQAAQRFQNDCKQDKATAREQAVRGTFDPGYFAYTVGKLSILELREEAKRRLGARFSLRRFHDALLSHGAPPVPLIRERVLAELGK